MFDRSAVPRSDDVDRLAFDDGSIGFLIVPAQPRGSAVSFADQVLDPDPHFRLVWGADGHHEAAKTFWAPYLKIAESLMVDLVSRNH